MPLCCPRRRAGSRPSFSLFRKHSDPAEKKEEDEEEEEEERECYDAHVEQLADVVAVGRRDCTDEQQRRDASPRHHHRCRRGCTLATMGHRHGPGP